MGNLRFRVWYDGNYSLSAFCQIDMNGNVWMFDTDGAAECDTVNITDKCSVEKCTGLKDKNGNLAYDGDIVVNVKQPDIPMRVFQDFTGSWQVISINDESRSKAIRLFYITFEIIGNIHTATVKE